MQPAALTLSPWAILLLAVPVIWLGERLVIRLGVLSRYSIPAAVVGGLLVASVLLALRAAEWGNLLLELGTTARAWTWLVTAEPDWLQTPVKSVNLPLLAAFFACVGLSASWQVVRHAGRQVFIFLLIVTAFAVLQNVISLLMAAWLRIPPLLGLVCGSMSLTGGHATTLGFAGEFERAGLAGAQTLGMAAATFGLVAGVLLAGPVGSGLIRKHHLAASQPASDEPAIRSFRGIMHDARTIVQRRAGLLRHALLLAFCLKAGAWISYLLQESGLTFPIFIGTMLAGVVTRNILDSRSARWFEPRLIEALASLCLALFLATAMMTLNLHELAFAAGPMLAIMGVQIAAMAAFAWWITFPSLGRDYEAAVMSAGHCGFGLGSTATAVAGMRAVIETTGPAPRAFLVVPLVGGFLVDLTNAINLTAFINLARS